MRFLLPLIAIMFTLGCSTPEPLTENQIEAGCVSDELRNQADLLVSIAQIKDACSWISNPEDYAACVKLPAYPSLGHELNCNRVKLDNSNLQIWLDTVGPEFSVACKNNQSCYQVWFYTFVTIHNFEPSWWDLKQGSPEDNKGFAPVDLEQAHIAPNPVEAPTTERSWKSSQLEEEYCLSVKFRDGLCMMSHKKPIEHDTVNLALWEEAREWWCNEYYGPDQECPEPLTAHWIDYSRLHE